MELGYLGAYNRHKPSPFEGFDVGGDGMVGYSIYGVDIIALRGYENGGLTPSNATHRYANVYNKYTVELRYPLVMQSSTMIWGIVFAEAGNGYLDWKNFNPFKVKRSMGVGARLYLPMIGLLGIDWGYGFDAPFGGTKANGGKVHFTMGITSQL
jgi:outer membrane protein insertion porin family